MNDFRRVLTLDKIPGLVCVDMLLG